MKKANELLLEFTALASRDPQKAAEMFTEDGAFEMPFLATFGFAPKYKGREVIAGFLQFVHELYPDFEFKNVQVLIDTPQQVFAECEFTAFSSRTERQVSRHSFGRLVAENGRIKLLREAANIFEEACATIVEGVGLP